jgi:2-polyprenyl-3-methyl-5-hydroxy-6-metoxy-1,4-benzoquinol methylase
MIIKHMKIGATGLTITIGDRIIETIRSNILYRVLIRPLRRVLFYLKNTISNEDGKGELLTTSRENHQVGMPEGNAEQKAILQRISEVEWYHSIDLGHGVITPGLFDHRPLLSHYHLPENLSDKRVLDVATYDGFWAFEFEKRGPSEVVAMDIQTWNEIDIPPHIRAGASREMLDKETGAGFNIARDILGSNVQRKIMNVYDLAPEWMGKFDVVFCSDLLLHLMNPMKALQNIQFFNMLVDPAGWFGGVSVWAA